MADGHDFVIVGAGAAGCVLAARLSELPDATVLLLEAGVARPTPAVEDPSRWNEVLLSDLDWAYLTEPQPGLAGTRVYAASGRGLGGTSNLYHMIHTRGRPRDFDAWTAAGCTGWSYPDVRPYFDRLERQIHVVSAAETGCPVSQTFIDACAELGYPRLVSFDPGGTGAGWHRVDIRDGRRSGARAEYLDPVLARPNLTVETGALASRLLFDGTRCVGVEYIKDGRLTRVRANVEVVVAAGALQSPKLLLLSGLGEPVELRELGIETVADLPGVGRNLQDHPLVIGPIGYLSRPGPPPRGNVTEVALFCPSEDHLAVPDLEICLVHRAPFGEQFFANVTKRVQTGQPVTATELVDPRVILSLPGLVRPVSRGWVRLAGTDPTAHPRIHPNYFGEATDLDRTVSMVDIARDILGTRAFVDGWGVREVAPGPDVKTRAALAEWVVHNTGSYYHFAGTCAMGGHPGAVVDSRLRVRGIDGLRVADASVMPAIVSANPHTTVLMIAERAAELITVDSR